ncbi:MAG: hypothetical protein JXA67_10755 [Micromonosporaceae bacterium]|nr:hypothetical protein [Micromonosporaceae bacterium]
MNATITVRAYLNTTQDANGLPLGMLDGYQPGHELTLVFETTAPATDDDLTVCEQVFRLLNVGDDPEFGTPDPRALEYRFKGHRSLSVGDVVDVDGRYYACARFGFTAIDTPHAAS